MLRNRFYGLYPPGKNCQIFATSTSFLKKYSDGIVDQKNDTTGMDVEVKVSNQEGFL